MKRSKHIPEKRDWIKHPDYHDWITEPNKASISLIEIGVILNSNRTDLEKLHEIHEMSSGYEREFIKATFITDKILTGKVKPRSEFEASLVKEHNKTLKLRAKLLKQEVANSKRFK